MTIAQALWIVAALALAASMFMHATRDQRNALAMQRSREAAQRKASSDALADKVGGHLATLYRAEVARSEGRANAQLADTIAMHAASVALASERLSIARGHRLYRATSQALVDASASEARTTMH